MRYSTRAGSRGVGQGSAGSIMVAAMDYTLKSFRNAGAERLHAAESLLNETTRASHKKASQKQSTSPRLRAQLAAYLMQIGLECWLKARILANSLSREKTRSVSVYRERFGVRGYDGRKRSIIFDSAEGHGLALLAKEASLERLLTAEGKRQLLADPCWNRMVHGERPYSLRYGAEDLSPEKAQEELTRARLIEDVIERNLGGA